MNLLDAKSDFWCTLANYTRRKNIEIGLFRRTDVGNKAGQNDIVSIAIRLTYAHTIRNFCEVFFSDDTAFINFRGWSTF